MKLTVLMGMYPQEESLIRREAVIRATSRGTDVEFVELRTTFYSKSSGAVAAAAATPLVCQASVESEKRGADAIMVFGSLDPGVEAASHIVDIPVLGSGRVGYNIASIIGDRIASLVYGDSSVSNARRLVRRYGLDDKVVSILSVGLGLSELSQAAESGDLKSRLIERGRQAVERDDAEVVFPQGVSMVPLHCDPRDLSRAIGVPIVDGLSACVRMAEFFVETGVTNSRGAYPFQVWSYTSDEPRADIR